jgi:hypothetical protein
MQAVQSCCLPAALCFRCDFQAQKQQMLTLACCVVPMGRGHAASWHCLGNNHDSWGPVLVDSTTLADV